MSARSSRAHAKVARKTRAAAKSRVVPASRSIKKSAGKSASFGEWARRVAGMVKSAQRDLSTREGFGD